MWHHFSSMLHLFHVLFLLFLMSSLEFFVVHPSSLMLWGGINDIVGVVRDSSVSWVNVDFWEKIK
jgi:hypothetical protein